MTKVLDNDMQEWLDYKCHYLKGCLESIKICPQLFETYLSTEHDGIPQTDAQPDRLPRQEGGGMTKIDLYHLVNCPFCGCDQMYTEYNPLYHMPWVVECCRCLAQGPHADTEKDALNLWNERVKE